MLRIGPLTRRRACRRRHFRLARSANQYLAAQVERLEIRTLLSGTDGPIISEIVASNSSGLADADGDHPDWIEIYNPTAETIDLAGWTLTDDPEVPDQWKFPETLLQAGAFLVVFASGKDRAVAGQELHTNFKLSTDGEYLGLYKPDESVADEFSPAFPQQATDVSYGVNFDTHGTCFARRVGLGESADRQFSPEFLGHARLCAGLELADRANGSRVRDLAAGLRRALRQVEHRRWAT